MKAVVVCALVLMALSVSSLESRSTARAMLDDALSAPGVRTVADLSADARRLVTAAYVAQDESVNQALADLIYPMSVDALPRFQATHGMASMEWDHTLANTFYLAQLPTEAHRARFRQMKAELVLAIASGQEWDPLGDLGRGISNAYNGAANAVGNAYNGAKQAVSNAVDTVSNMDVNKLANTVRDGAAKVGEFTGNLAPVLDTAATLTAAIPGVGEVVGGAAALNHGINTAATVTETAAGLVADHTTPGETVGHALGRAGDAIKDGVNKAGEYIKDPSKLAHDVGQAAKDCMNNPGGCAAKALDAAGTVAGLMGNSDLRDGLQDAAEKVDDMFGKDDDKGKDGDDKEGGEKEDGGKDGGDKEDGKEGPAPDDKEGGGGGGGGDREGGDREGGDREGGDREGGDRDGGERGGRRGRGERGGRRGRGERRGRRGRGERRGRRGRRGGR